MTDLTVATFVDENGDSIFSGRVPFAPRIGETIYFSFHSSEVDRQKWSEESWQHEKSLDGKEWAVINVHHEFRRYRVDTLQHILFVTVKPKAKPAKKAGKTK